MFEWHADLIGKGNRLLNSENNVDWIWFNCIPKIGYRGAMSVKPKMILLFQSFDSTALTMLNWKFFWTDFVAVATSLENLSNMFEIGNNKNKQLLS